MSVFVAQFQAESLWFYPLHNKYQVAKVSPGGSFVPFAPLAVNPRIGRESAKRPWIREKAANPQKGCESAKRPRIPEKAANPQKGHKSAKKPRIPEKGPESLKKAPNPRKRPRIPEKAPNPWKGPESLKKASNLWKRLYSSYLFAPPLLSSPFSPPNSIHIATKGLHRSPPRAKNVGEGSK